MLSIMFEGLQLLICSMVTAKCTCMGYTPCTITFLIVNYSGYQNSELVNKQQPADGAAPSKHVVAPQEICSKPRLQVSG